MAHEEQRRHPHSADLWRACIDPRVWLLIGVYSTVAVGANASGAYFPRLLKDRFTGRGEFTIGLLAALPHLCAIVGMTLLGAHSDRKGERSTHVACAALLAQAGWALSAFTDDPW